MILTTMMMIITPGGREMRRRGWYRSIRKPIDSMVSPHPLRSKMRPRQTTPAVSSQSLGSVRASLAVDHGERGVRQAGAGVLLERRVDVRAGASRLATPCSHHEKCVLAGPTPGKSWRTQCRTLGSLTALPINKKVPLNKYCAAVIYIYIYIFTHICICVYVSMYIYIYIYCDPHWE